MTSISILVAVWLLSLSCCCCKIVSIRQRMCATVPLIQKLLFARLLFVGSLLVAVVESSSTRSPFKIFSPSSSPQPNGTECRPGIPNVENSSSRRFFCCLLLGTNGAVAGDAVDGAGAGAAGVVVVVRGGGGEDIPILLLLLLLLLLFRCRRRCIFLSNLDPTRPDIPPTARTSSSMPAVGTHNVKKDDDGDDDDEYRRIESVVGKPPPAVSLKKKKMLVRRKQSLSEQQQ
mmetsp:Transcript_37103/g.89935  ORF Transcript_37103/g.89935 Transcript_37103/m.89935 type:complete len:231 (+) Transcript_37103:222-914(+)